jgi:uncharacterized protein YndB with AHSA1/START domain
MLANRIASEDLTAIHEEPSARAQMLIRKPTEEVFDAFVEPTATTIFWLIKSSGKLEPGRIFRLDWEMYGASAQIDVKAVEKYQQILIGWSGNGATTSVEWLFTSRGDNTTLLRISNWGFEGSDEEKVEQAKDSKGGFTLVLAGLKALLEHNVILNLVADQYPDAHK